MSHEPRRGMGPTGMLTGLNDVDLPVRVMNVEP